VAVLIDATVVRGVVLPACLALLGERAWYLPSWLAWLPGRNLAGEGAPAVIRDAAGGPGIQPRGQLTPEPVKVSVGAR
jgi:RND superfamily putative drug exporter